MAGKKKKIFAYELDDYQPLDLIAREHKQFSANQLRWLVANKERYGLSSSIKRIGRKLYFHVPSLIEWVREQNA